VGRVAGGEGGGEGGGGGGGGQGDVVWDICGIVGGGGVAGEEGERVLGFFEAEVVEAGDLGLELGFAVGEEVGDCGHGVCEAGVEDGVEEVEVVVQG